jgi:hypothetical protein
MYAYRKHDHRLESSSAAYAVPTCLTRVFNKYAELFQHVRLDDKAWEWRPYSVPAITQGHARRDYKAEQVFLVWYTVYSFEISPKANQPSPGPSQ